MNDFSRGWSGFVPPPNQLVDVATFNEKFFFFERQKKRKRRRSKNNSKSVSKSSTDCLQLHFSILSLSHTEFACSFFGIFKPLLIAFHRVHLAVYLVHIMWIKIFITPFVVAHTKKHSLLMLKMTITGSRVEIENLFILCWALFSLSLLRVHWAVSAENTHELELQEHKKICLYISKQTKSLLSRRLQLIPPPPPTSHHWYDSKYSATHSGKDKKRENFFLLSFISQLPSFVIIASSPPSTECARERGGENSPSKS